MKAFRQTIQELSANDKLDKLSHNKPLSGSRLKQLTRDFSAYEDIDFDQWQGYPHPRNSSQVTKNEIHNLVSLGQNRDQWEKDIIMHDKKVIQAFREYLDKHGLEVDLDRIEKLRKQASPILLSLKRFYNRPRPNVLAKKLGLALTFFPLTTAETPSYPSGHATQGRLVAKLVADEVPFEHRRNILDIGTRIGHSRQVAGAHYQSDTEFGHRLGDELYRLASTRKEPELSLEYLTWELDTLNELEVANKKALQKYIGDLKTGKMRAATIVKYTDSGKKSTVGKEVPDAATDDDKKDKKDKKKPELKKKDKSLKNVDTSDSEVYKTSDTGVSDTEFNNNKKIKSPYKNKEDELQESTLDPYFKSGKIPKKYQKVITRLMNSTDGGQKITDYMSGVGAGKLSAQAGEILTMASLAMSDEEFDGFIKVLTEQNEKLPKGSKPVVTKEWLDSVKAVRSTTKKRYDSKYGKGNWSISNTAWDVPGEFEALGNDDYKKNKGFSTDMYVKLEVDGKPVLDEISLKKDSKANIFNGTVTEINKWSKNVPPRADIKEYKKGEIKRVTDYTSKSKTLEYNPNDLIKNEKVLKDKNLKTTLDALGVITGDAKKGFTIPEKAQKILDKLSTIKVPPPIDHQRFAEVFGTKDKKKFKKYMLMHAAVTRANEIATGVEGETESSKFLNQHLGYEKGEDGKYPEGSIKRYQNDTIEFLVEDEEAKEGCLNALAEKLPLKALFEGEESMAIGALSADTKTLNRVFGVDNYEDLKTGLTMTEDDEGNNYLVYESKGPPAKNVKIAEVQCRQKGQGYASSVGLEFKIAPEFGQELYKANSEEYPPEPEITDKERKNLKLAKKAKKEEKLLGFNEWIS